jgi:hypothetical protein
VVTGWKRLIVPRATDNGITFTLSAKWKAVRELFRRAPEIPDVRSRGTGNRATALYRNNSAEYGSDTSRETPGSTAVWKTSVLSGETAGCANS